MDAVYFLIAVASLETGLPLPDALAGDRDFRRVALVVLVGADLLQEETGLNEFLEVPPWHHWRKWAEWQEIHGEVKDFPRSTEIRRFQLLPDGVTQTRVFLDDCLAHANGLLALYPAREDEIAALVGELARRRAAWHTLENAQNYQRWNSTRYVRQQLDELRSIIGPAGFYGGYLPDPVPLEYWRRIP